MSHRARAEIHDQSWRAQPLEQMNIEQERWLKEERKALDRLIKMGVGLVCPACDREFIGNEYAALGVKGERMVLVHTDCLGGARAAKWQIVQDPGPVTKYTR